MKRLAILPLIITIACAMLSSDAPDIITEAKAKTDMQIESVYTGPVDPVIDAIRYNFREIRGVMDSLNAETILAIHRAESASTERDSLAIAMLELIDDNINLALENQSKEKEIKLILDSPKWIVIFGVVFAACTFSIGFIEGLKAIRKSSTDAH